MVANIFRRRLRLGGSALTVVLVGGGGLVASPAVAAGHAITGVVVQDVDLDGLRGPSDHPMAGVTVEVFEHVVSNGGSQVGFEPRADLITDGDGRYRAEGLEPGRYLVSLMLPTGLRDQPERRLVDLGGEADVVADAVVTAVVTGQLSLPAQPVPPVFATAHRVIGSGGDVSRHLLSQEVIGDASNPESFNGHPLELPVAPGTIEVRVPVGFATFDGGGAVLSNREVPGLQPTDFSLSTGIATFELRPGQPGPVLNALYDPAASVHGTIFEDRDGDGRRAADEAGLAGVTVRADSASSGYHQQVTTDANGLYEMHLLPTVDDLVITVVHPQGLDTSGVRFSPRDAPGSDDLDSEVSPIDGTYGPVMLDPRSPLVVDAGILMQVLPATGTPSQDPLLIGIGALVLGVAILRSSTTARAR